VRWSAAKKRMCSPTLAGYQGVAKREEVQGIEVNWHVVAMRPGKRRALDKDSTMGAVLEQLEHVKARIRAKGIGNPTA